MRSTQRYRRSGHSRGKVVDTFHLTVKGIEYDVPIRMVKDSQSVPRTLSNLHPRDLTSVSFAAYDDDLHLDIMSTDIAVLLAAIRDALEDVVKWQRYCVVSIESGGFRSSSVGIQLDFDTVWLATIKGEDGEPMEVYKRGSVYGDDVRRGRPSGSRGSHNVFIPVSDTESPSKVRRDMQGVFNMLIGTMASAGKKGSLRAMYKALRAAVKPRGGRKGAKR